MEIGPEMKEEGTPKLYVQYNGVWDMDELYNLIARFFLGEKFKFYEKRQRRRKPGPFGYETLYKFEAQRDIDEYHRWIVHVHLETFDEHDVEAQDKHGRKRKMTKGKLWIQLRGEMITDYENKWEGSMVALYLRTFYNKYVIKKRYEALFWDPLYYKVLIRLQAAIKDHLGMESRGYEHRYGAGVH